MFCFVPARFIKVSFTQTCTNIALNSWIPTANHLVQQKERERHLWDRPGSVETSGRIPNDMVVYRIPYKRLLSYACSCRYGGEVMAHSNEWSERVEMIDVNQVLYHNWSGYFPQLLYLLSGSIGSSVMFLQECDRRSRVLSLSRGNVPGTGHYWICREGSYRIMSLCRSYNNYDNRKQVYYMFDYICFPNCHWSIWVRAWV